MHSYVALSTQSASVTNTTDQNLNGLLVDKVFQTVLVWVLKLEFIVIG